MWVWRSQTDWRCRRERGILEEDFKIPSPLALITDKARIQDTMRLPDKIVVKQKKNKKKLKKPRKKIERFEDEQRKKMVEN